MKNLIKPLSIIMIDLFTLAIGPSHCDLELKDCRLDKVLGRMLFDIEFQQMQEIEVQLKDLACKMDGKEDKPYYGLFKAVTAKETPQSKQTASLFGEYDKDKNKTLFNWSMSQDLYEDPSVTFMATMDNLKQSTIQLCIYHDREFQRSDATSTRNRKKSGEEGSQLSPGGFQQSYSFTSMSKANMNKSGVKL